MKKNKLFILGMLALVLALGLALAGCDDGTTNGGGGARTKFEGRWWNRTQLMYGYSDYSFTFTGNTFVFKKENVDGNPYNNRVTTGTFTFTDTYFTWFPGAGENWVSFSQTYDYFPSYRTFTLGDAQQQDSAGWDSSGRFEKQ